MSQELVVEPQVIQVASPTSPKLMYAKDFLLKYQDCKKVDPTIQSIVSPILSPDSQRKQSVARVVDGTPKRRLNFENSPAKTTNAAAKGSRTPKPNVLKPIVLPQLSKSVQKERPTSAVKKWSKGTEIPSIQVNSPSKVEKRNPLTQISANVANNLNVTRSPSMVVKTNPIIRQVAPSPKPVLPDESVNDKAFTIPSENSLVQIAISPIQSPFKPSPPKTSLTNEALPKSNSLQPKSQNKVKSSSPAVNDRSTYLTPQLGKAPSLATPVPRVSLSTPTRKLPSPLDEHRVAQRMKQIEYGYKTVGYLRYRLLVPKDHRASDHPRTPRKEQGCSKRSWDGQLKKWRRELHRWDPEDVKAFEALLESDIVKSIIVRSKDLSAIIEDVKQKMREDPKGIAKDGFEDDSIDMKENETPGDITPGVIVSQSNDEQITASAHNISLDTDMSNSLPDIPEITPFDKVARALSFENY